MNLEKLVRDLRRVAKEIEDTAKGSGRVEAYKAYAAELRELADQVERDL